MARLIDADRLQELFNVTSSALLSNVDLSKDIEHVVRACLMVSEMISDAPTVDAVEVVRCRDCKWWDADDNGLYGYCMAMKHGYMSANWEIGIYRKYKGDFYCADGERKEDEVEE